MIQKEELIIVGMDFIILHFGLELMNSINMVKYIKIYFIKILIIIFQELAINNKQTILNFCLDLLIELTIKNNILKQLWI